MNIMKKNDRLKYLNEPLLSFSNGQSVIDPRDGLTLFGPFSDELNLSSQLGIIGTPSNTAWMKGWLNKVMKPVFSYDEVARPHFPGIEAAFGLSINVDAIPTIEVSSQSIEEFLKYQDGHQRVHNLANLFTDKLIKYDKEEAVPVRTWFIVIPEDIYRYGRPKSKIPSSEENVRKGLRKKERQPGVQFLFDNLNELKEAYEYEVNFHNQIKAKLLPHKVITQIVKEKTIAYEHVLENPDAITKERIFDSAKAWNIATTLYYKLGGLPWKLGSIREGVCYLGLVYKQIEQSRDLRTACCAAQMFLDSGDGMVFRGNDGKYYNPDTREYHLTENDAQELISRALDAFYDKNGTYPKQVFIHARTNFNDQEWNGFQKASKGKTEILGVKIRDDRVFKLFRRESYPVARGTAFLIDDKSAFLWTRGFIPRLQTVMGLETPNPLKIELIRGDEDILQVCRDVLALTKLNYNACTYGDGQPVTLRFADSIGNVLTSGPTNNVGILNFKHYI